MGRNEMGSPLIPPPPDYSNVPPPPDAETNYTPPGAVRGSPGTNPLTPSWALPFAGQPQMGGREAAGRLAGAAGYTATGGMAGLPGAAARIGVGAAQGGIQNGIEGAVAGTLLNALIEGGLPVAGRVLSAIPFLRNLLPMRPAVNETTRTWSHSPWVGQSVAPNNTEMMLQGPVMARDEGLIPSLIRLQLQRGGAPTVHSGPVTMTERSVSQPARHFLPNPPPFVRALEEYLTGNTVGQLTGGGQ